MLKLLQTIDIAEKKEILKEFNFDEGLWITSDIKSQAFILNLKSDIQENSVIRASNFWSHLLAHVQPESALVNRNFLLPIYHKWAYKKEEWQKNQKTAILVCQHIEALSHLLQHPLKDQLIEEWKKKFTDRREQHWAKWYNLSVEFWQYLADQKIIETSWASACLIDKISFDYFKKKELVFDLGFNINKIEVELIRQISSELKVTVLEPFYQEGTYIASIYADFNLGNTTKKPPAPKVRQNLKVKKFSTALAEVKDISAQIKQAIKEGMEPSKISVLAPHIENYWPCLKSYFQKENIPFNKSEMVYLHSFHVVQTWFANMWTHLSVFKYENLEALSVYKNQGHNQYIPFSKIKSQFHNIKDVRQWPSSGLKTTHLKNKNELVTQDHFIKWAEELLPSFKGQSSFVSKSTRAYLNNFLHSSTAVQNLELKWQSWLHLLELHFKKTELEVKKHSTGVHCLSFNALSWLDSDLIYIIGLSEQNMFTKKHDLISSLEAHSITEDLGFFIKIEPSDKLEQIISCFVHNQGDKNLNLSFSATDFLGTSLNPSCFWLQKAIECKKNIHNFDTPGCTLWDKQQRKSTIKDILSSQNKSPEELNLIGQSIQEDMDIKEPADFFEEQVQKLSASALDLYVKCPFMLTAKKIFNLWDGPERDMDIPAMDHGNMMHKLFEILKIRQLDTSSEEEILKIIDEIRQDPNLNKQILKVHPIIWEKEKSILLKKALQFFEHERERKILFKSFKTVSCEQKYNCYWNLKTKELAKEGQIEFTGKIDRIDSDDKSYQIIDYKSSLPAGTNISTWESQNNFQMAFYIQVVEKGLAESITPLPVNSALYMSYKNFDYKGFAIKDAPYIELLGGPKKRSLISEDKKKDILEKVNHKIHSLILEIHQGKFHPKPKTKNLCITCRWSRICRAKHLN